jgi:hypothetical protein
MHPIGRMIEIATQDGVDVVRMGIPTDIFIAEWENQFGMNMPEGFVEEIEREYPKGLLPTIAAQYWIQLDGWFMDNTNDED